MENGKFVVGEIYTLVEDCPAWRASDVNPEENEVWQKFSYIKDDQVIFKAGGKFKKVDDEFINGEIGFEMANENGYEMAFKYKNQKQLNKIYKSFGLRK